MIYIGTAAFKIFLAPQALDGRYSREGSMDYTYET